MFFYLQIVAIINTIIGAACVVIFQVVIKEPDSKMSLDIKHYGSIDEQKDGHKKTNEMTWRSWLKEIQFYQVGVIRLLNFYIEI